MRFSTYSAIVAFATAVVAQTANFDAMTSPYQDQTVTVGSTLDINWQPEAVTGTITITLLQGDTPSTLQLGAVITSGLDNTVATFPYVPTSAGFATYGFKISLDSDPTTFQYSFPFHVVAAGASSTAAAASSSITVTIAPGPSYTPSSSAVSSPVYTSSVVSSAAYSSAVASSSVAQNATCTTLTSSAVYTATVPYSNGTATASSVKGSNYTLTSLTGYSAPTSTLVLTSVVGGATGASSAGGASGPSATSTLAPPTANAAVTNAAAGGLAMIGLAFALLL